MSRYLRLLPVFLLGSVLGEQSQAQDTAGWISELRELRKTVEQQSKQIEVLTQQIARLNATLEGKTAAGPAPAPAAGPTASTSPSAASAPATSAPEEFTPPATPAEPGAPKHVVMKGETLTSIAKHYNISLPELLKANKDINERKLQIGQTINLPPNIQPKNPEPPEKGQP